MSNSFNAKSSLNVNGKSVTYYSLPEAEKNGLAGISRLPYPLKILLENLLRNEDGNTVTNADLEAFTHWLKDKTSNHEIAYRPARVLMQDFTGVPAVVDLAAMRNAMQELGGDAKQINPLCPVDLVIDHSVQIDAWSNHSALKENVDIEMQRNHERYQFLRWGQQAFDNFRVVPPGTGICHQVNLEYLAKVVWTKEENGETVAYPDTLVGTDSHTTMINGLGVLGWGVGGIEAEAAMLGQPISMLIPEVVGFKLTGKLAEGVTATDLVLTVVQMLRAHGVVGKFVQFYGSGLHDLPLADRATIGNMSPEYGATCGIFPVDQVTLDYLKLSGRDKETLALVEAYAKAQGLWHDASTEEPIFSSTLELDMSEVRPSVSGPKRPQDKVLLEDLPTQSTAFIDSIDKSGEITKDFDNGKFTMHHGDVVIAAITSCTNTSNPAVMLAAGLVAKKALEKGLSIKPWVKPSLAPGSKVVTEYLNKTDLMKPLNDLGFNLVGYGCTTCIGNSGPLSDEVTQLVTDNDITANAVLSGNRNFEGRIHPLVKANWLASPPLVVAFAIAGTTLKDLTKEPVGQDQDGNDVFLKDIWPSNQEIAQAERLITNEMFNKEYADVFKGDDAWQSIEVTPTEVYNWDENSTYVRQVPFFMGMSKQPGKASDINAARILALLGDSVTTDHISPAGAIKLDSPAGRYLVEHDVAQKDFNSYGSRRGNHEVMMRGTFANIRIRNEIVPGVEGGYTKHFPGGEQQAIYDAAMQYQQEGTPLVIIAGKEYGSGSSRDWAAKGTLLQGVKAVITESFERIHRSNLIGMGVLPLQFVNGETRENLQLQGDEIISIHGLEQGLQPKMTLTMIIERNDGSTKEVPVQMRIDTQNELEYYLNGGILQYVLRSLT